MSDLISRAAAIDALEKIDCSDGVGISSLKCDAVYDAVTAIKALPSAQPEIIRCKDCKHRDPEDKKCDCGHGIWWQLPRQDNWFCADAERRTDE